LLDARGDVHAQALDRAARARAVARRARRLDDRAAAAAARARLRDREEALPLGLDAAPLADGADGRRRAGSRARAVARLAGRRGRDRERRLRAFDRLLEAQRDLRLQVAPALRARAAASARARTAGTPRPRPGGPAAAPEQVGEDVAEGAE